MIKQIYKNLRRRIIDVLYPDARLSLEDACKGMIRAAKIVRDNCTRLPKT